MKIVRIELYKADLPYDGGVYLLSGGRQYTSFDASFVRIVCDNGIEGWGEHALRSDHIASHALGTRAGIAEIAPALIGRDPRQVDRINDLMDVVLVGHNHAKTALDVACWDAFGKSVNMPVCELLGGGTGIPLPMISSIYAGDPDEMRRRVADHRARGYLGHSIKIGALDGEGGPALDAARIAAALADRRPGEYFVVDANGGLLPETALRMFQMLPHGLDFVLEGAVRDDAGDDVAAQALSLPIMVDELAQLDEDVAFIVANDVADSVGLKISKAGGLTHGRRQRDICRAAGLTMSVQETAGSAVAFAAIVHLGATVPTRLLRCVLNSQDMLTLKTAKFGATISDGGVLPPDLPGLGIEVDVDVLGEPLTVWE